MNENLSRRQKINIELAEKTKNTHTKNILNKLLPSKLKHAEIIKFNCECSDPKCNKKVDLTLKQYEIYSKKRKQFVLAKGHITKEIEKPLVMSKGYTVVEKFSI